MKTSVEGTSAKAVRQEESCRHFKKRNRQMWPKSSEGEVESLEMKTGSVTYRSRSESGFSVLHHNWSCDGSSVYEVR